MPFQTDMCYQKKVVFCQMENYCD